MQNAHGDVVNLTDAEGAVTRTYRYDAFGVELSPVIGDVNVFRYCGEYFDTETGTVYLRARYYQASIGRFTQRDTVAGKLGDPLSLNLYTYAHNNPIFYFDPSGHTVKEFWECVKETINNGIDTWNQGYEECQRIDRAAGAYAEQKVLRPLWEDTKTFFRAVGTSTSLTFGVGCGFGVNVKAVEEFSFMAVPMRDEYVLAYDCKANRTSRFELYAQVYDNMSIGAQCDYSRYNDTINYGVPGYWQQPDGKWDVQIGVQMEDYLLGYSTTENVLQDVNLSFGGGIYILLGADIDFSFNVSNFFRVISGLEEEQS